MYRGKRGGMRGGRGRKGPPPMQMQPPPYGYFGGPPASYYGGGGGYGPPSGYGPPAGYGAAPVSRTPGPAPMQPPAPAPTEPPTPLSAAQPQQVPQMQQQQQMYAFKPPPFDAYLCEQFFPRNTTDAEESALTQLLLTRNQEISPSAAEQAAISSLVTKIKQVLDKIVVAPESFTAVSIEEVREVGSYKKGTMLKNHNVADVAVILKSLPTIESVNALGQKIVQEMKADYNEIFGCVARDFGCEIAGTQAVVRLLVTILPQSAKLLEPDLHLPEKIMQANMATIRHARWFEEHATHSSIKVLIRLLKYVRNKFDGLKGLSVWAIDILAHYCVMHTQTRAPLPLGLAFKRFFHVLSTGILLPNSQGLVDPCDPQSRIHYTLSLDEMDIICSTAQTLLRIIIHGGSEQVLSSENGPTIATDVSIWKNVVVTPLEKAYSPEDMEPYFGKPQEIAAESA